MQFQTKAVVIGVASKDFTDRSGVPVSYFIITVVADDKVYFINTKDKVLADKLRNEKMKEVVLQLQVIQNHQGYTKLSFAN